MKIQINLGLNTNTNETFRLQQVLESTYRALNRTEFDYRVTESTTEPTLVISYQSQGESSFMKLMGAVRQLANELDQDCIALKTGEVGQLIYSDKPKNDWGLFNEEYFINY